jgi:FkbM family methyltransferase
MIRKGMSRADIEYIGKAYASNTAIANILNLFKLHVDLRETSIAGHLSKDGFWEAWITRWFIDNIRPDSICVDAGANYGYFTRLMAHLSGPRGLVYAIEANPELTMYLEQSLRVYPDDKASAVTVFNYALADTSHRATLTVYGDNYCDSTILPNEEPDVVAHTFTIQAHPLTSLIPDKITVDILKLDIEGAEFAAYQGMRSMLDRIEVIVMEVNPGVVQKNPRFIHELYVTRDVSYITYSGDEKPILYEELAYSKEPVMLVLRKSDSNFDF